MSKSALIAEDSASMRQMVDFTLSNAGFDVTSGANGQEALDRADDKTYDLVITDLNMPVMDGISFIRSLREKPEFKFTPILMLTTESQTEKKMEAKSAGATGWIVKPFNPQQLLDVVGKVVR